MKNVKLLLLMSFLFLTEMGFSQNTVTYSTLSKTIDLNSGVEGTVDIVVNCYGSSSTPVFLNAIQSCGNNDGILSTTYTNGNILTPGQNTIIRYKFKKTVTTDTQIVYKFSTNGSCLQNESNMIKITVNYKSGSITNPTNPSFSTDITIVQNYNGSIISNFTINEGNVCPSISLINWGWISEYNLQWERKIGPGIWTPISGEVSRKYEPGVLLQSTSYRITARINSNKYISNEIAITVIPAPAIQHNIITLNGNTVSGSLPTGGLGNDSYRYIWSVMDEDGESRDLPFKSQSVMLSEPAFAIYLKSAYNFKLVRLVISGSQGLSSNYVDIPHISPIQNNIISINGNQVTGTVPTGGIGEYNGDYTYLWGVFYEDGEAVRDLPFTSQNVMLSEPVFDIFLKSAYNFKLARIAYSGDQRLFSNYVDLPHITGKQSNTISINNNQIIDKTSSISNEFSKDDTITGLSKVTSAVVAVYPNPTSGSVNFTTSFSSNKEIEIIVYSEEFGKTQSVFKGIATPNQIVTWDIPSNHPKGIYFYKIVSGNEDIKSGKIIFQ